MSKQRSHWGLTQIRLAPRKLPNSPPPPENVGALYFAIPKREIAILFSCHVALWTALETTINSLGGDHLGVPGYTLVPGYTPHLPIAICYVAWLALQAMHARRGHRKSRDCVSRLVDFGNFPPRRDTFILIIVVGSGCRGGLKSERLENASSGAMWPAWNGELTQQCRWLKCGCQIDSGARETSHGESDKFRFVRRGQSWSSQTRMFI